MRLSGFFLALLVALIMVEAYWLGLALYGRLAGTMVLVAPLLVCVPFVASGGHRARFVAALISLPYLIHGITEFAVSGGSNWLALAVSALCVALYVLLILARRDRQPQGS